MIDIYLTDIIKKVDITTNEYGLITQTESTNIKARVEDYNKLIMDDKGKEVIGEMLIYVKTASNFNFGDKIIIKKKAGIEYEQPDKKFIIKKKCKVTGFSPSHWELYV